MNASRMALQHLTNAFCNSLVRDLNLHYHAENRSFYLHRDEVQIRLPVTRHTSVGVHEFSAPFQFTTSTHSREIGFFEAAEWICSSWSKTPRELYARILLGHRQLEQTLRERALAIGQTHWEELDFIQAEQAFVLGHNVHPTPKSRDEFTDDDLRAFAPEYAPRVELVWWLVDPSILWEEKSATQMKSAITWQRELYGRHESEENALVPFPLHPWQANVLKDDPVIKEYRQRGLIRHGSISHTPWSPTSSLRALYHAQAPFMVKFSLSLRITNSIRHMQQTEVVRGMVLHDIFQSPRLKQFKTEFPFFDVLHEPAAMAIRGLDHAILPQTTVLIRQNLPTREGHKTVMLAALNQPHPFGLRSWLAEIFEHTSPHDFFQAFLQHVLRPLIILQANYGVLLGAHQQNLLVTLRNDVPVGGFFRDCQGIGLSPLAMAQQQDNLDLIERMRPHCLTESSAVDLFTYYLLINSVFGTVAAVAREGQVSESSLLAQLNRFLESLASSVKDPHILTHWLKAPALRQKGNFRCNLERFNENTTSDPLAIYNPYPNPLQQEQL